MSDTESRHEFQISSYIWFRGYSLMFLTFFFLKIAFSWVRYHIDPRQSTRKHPSSRKVISGGRSARKRTFQHIHLDKGRDRLKHQRSVCRSHSPSISFGTRLTESLVGVSEAFLPFSPEWCSAFHDLDWSVGRSACVCHPCFSNIIQVPILSLSTLYSWELKWRVSPFLRAKQLHRQLQWFT